MRDLRASKILTSRFRVQAWFALCGHEWPLVSFIGEDLVQTTVELDDGGNGKTALLVEFNSCVISFEDDWAEDQEKLRNITARLTFCWVGLPVMICARLVDMSSQPGEKVMVRICNPTAVGGTTPSLRMPATGYALFHNSLLTEKRRPEVDCALRWYLAGLAAADPFAETVCLWAAIEALSPEVKQPPRCRKCNKELLPCPSCCDATPQPVVLASIREYLVSQLGVSKKEINALYEYRCKLAHGRHDPTAVTFPQAARHAADVRPMVECVLCKELGVSNDRQLLLEQPDHFTINFDAIFSRPWQDDVYDRPGPLFDELKMTFEPPTSDFDGS